MSCDRSVFIQILAVFQDVELVPPGRLFVGVACPRLCGFLSSAGSRGWLGSQRRASEYHQTDTTQPPRNNGRRRPPARQRHLRQAGRCPGQRCWLVSFFISGQERRLRRTDHKRDQALYPLFLLLMFNDSFVGFGAFPIFTSHPDPANVCRIYFHVSGGIRASTPRHASQLHRLRSKSHNKPMSCSSPLTFAHTYLRPLLSHLFWDCAQRAPGSPGLTSSPAGSPPAAVSSWPATPSTPPLVSCPEMLSPPCWVRQPGCGNDASSF